MTDNESPTEERLVAAVDLGSNSFHMTVARLTPSGLQILSRDKERVRLASGLGADDVLDADAIERGLETLARFDARLSSVAPEDIRAVATHTLREAVNANVFLDRAAAVFRAPIEIISGPEEARLIFHAVGHTQPVGDRYLVFDIGGGSTEFAVGTRFQPEFLSSRSLGCVTFSTFFGSGVGKKAFSKADLASRRVMEPIVERIRALPADKVFATSGTAKGISALGNHLGFGPRITPQSVAECQKFLAKPANRERTDIPDVSLERMQVLPAGCAIMGAILDELGLTQVIFADSALREGVLYTMDDRLKHSDIRERTAIDLAAKYGIDRDQADRVRNSVQHIVEQIAEAWQFKHEDRQMLIWAATLHEIGLQINYSGFHRHGAYIVANTPLPGFNREQQDVLATLIRLHRKRLDLSVIPELRNWSSDRILRLIRVLRIACVLNFGRHDEMPFNGHIRTQGESLNLEFPDGVLESHPVVAMDLDEEIKRQQEAGFKLSVI